jgi:hypothetical protein
MRFEEKDTFCVETEGLTISEESLAFLLEGFLRTWTYWPRTSPSTLLLHTCSIHDLQIITSIRLETCRKWSWVRRSLVND